MKVKKILPFLVLILLFIISSYFTYLLTLPMEKSPIPFLNEYSICFLDSPLSIDQKFKKHASSIIDYPEECNTDYIYDVEILEQQATIICSFDQRYQLFSVKVSFEFTENESEMVNIIQKRVSKIIEDFYNGNPDFAQDLISSNNINYSLNNGATGLYYNIEIGDYTLGVKATAVY